MDSRIPIGNVIFGVEKSLENIKGVYRKEVRTKLKALQKLVDKNEPVHRTVDKAWALLEMVRWETECLPGVYMTQAEFYEAVFGFEVIDTKDDFNFCDEYRRENTISLESRNRFWNLYERYLTGSMSAKYRMRELRMEWDDGQ